jgi:hypothetical protein
MATFVPVSQNNPSSNTATPVNGMTPTGGLPSTTTTVIKPELTREQQLEQQKRELERKAKEARERGLEEARRRLDGGETNPTFRKTVRVDGTPEKPGTPGTKPIEGVPSRTITIESIIQANPSLNDQQLAEKIREGLGLPPGTFVNIDRLTRETRVGGEGSLVLLGKTSFGEGFVWTQSYRENNLNAIRSLATPEQFKSLSELDLSKPENIKKFNEISKSIFAARGTPNAWGPGKNNAYVLLQDPTTGVREKYAVPGVVIPGTPGQPGTPGTPAQPGTPPISSKVEVTGSRTESKVASFPFTLGDDNQLTIKGGVDSEGSPIAGVHGTAVVLKSKDGKLRVVFDISKTIGGGDTELIGEKGQAALGLILNLGNPNSTSPFAVQLHARLGGIFGHSKFNIDETEIKIDGETVARSKRTSEERGQTSLQGEVGLNIKAAPGGSGKVIISANPAIGKTFDGEWSWVVRGALKVYLNEARTFHVGVSGFAANPFKPVDKRQFDGGVFIEAGIQSRGKKPPPLSSVVAPLTGARVKYEAKVIDSVHTQMNPRGVDPGAIPQAERFPRYTVTELARKVSVTGKVQPGEKTINLVSITFPATDGKPSPIVSLEVPEGEDPNQFVSRISKLNVPQYRGANRAYDAPETVRRWIQELKVQGIQAATGSEGQAQLAQSIQSRLGLTLEEAQRVASDPARLEVLERQTQTALKGGNPLPDGVTIVSRKTFVVISDYDGKISDYDGNKAFSGVLDSSLIINSKGELIRRDPLHTEETKRQAVPADSLEGILANQVAEEADFRPGVGTIVNGQNVPPPLPRRPLSGTGQNNIPSPEPDSNIPVRAELHKRLKNGESVFTQ